ncbi:uncharacterized protein LOC115755052 isoform X2 [Rhodamnia argentea]|uniref:Uncharacterized protein LOC115755052 isoform X2 n=1 Tax=Rhodamnia argentea TaxID=178133 RepID=A0ABM3H0I7_9MYRT|nr:uncharacterized protein LOC115755052 isoform X2 [Rhodamnia argentea]
MDLSAKRQSWFGHFYQTLFQEGDGTMKQDFDHIEKQVEAVGEKMKRLCSKIFHDVQRPERDVMRFNPHLDSEGYTPTSGSANSMKSVEKEPGKSIPNQSQVACPLENYVDQELSKPDPFILDPRLDPQRVESNDEHVQMITEQLQVTCHVDPFQEPIEPQTSNSSSQNSIEVPASSSDVGLPNEHMSFDSVKNPGHTLDNPSQEPEQSQPQTSNPSSQNLFEVPESSSDLGLLDKLTTFDSVKNQLGHTINDPSQEPTGSQTSDPSSPNLFEVPETSSALELLDITFAFDSVKNPPGHLLDDASQEKSESQTHNPSSKNLFEVPESSDMVLLDEPTAFGSAKNQQRHMCDSPEAPVSVHLLEGERSRLSLGCTDGALAEEKAPKFWKENAMPGGSSAPEVYLISSVEKDLCEADFLSIHLPSDDIANTASLGSNKLSPANSVHAEEDLVPSDNFTVEAVCSIGASNMIAASDMSSPVASHEQEAKTRVLESLSNPVKVESYESEILPEVNFQRGSFCDEEVGIARCIPHRSNFAPFALSVENASTFSDDISLTEAHRKEHIQFADSAEFHDLSFSSDKDEEVKLEESCVALDSRELYALSLRIQRIRSFKKKIMDTFAPRQRTVKEYEQLGIWYEDSQIESELNREIEHTTSPRAISAFSDCQSSQEHQIDADWELL